MYLTIKLNISNNVLPSHILSSCVVLALDLVHSLFDQLCKIDDLGCISSFLLDCYQMIARKYTLVFSNYSAVSPLCYSSLFAMIYL